LQDIKEKAKNYAFLLLKFRPRSEREITWRLKKKKFDPEIISQTVAFLKEKKFIDDNYFASAWIESRLKRPLGLRRIRQELAAKGIAKEIIDSEIGRIKENYSEDGVIKGLALKKFKTLKGLDPQKAKSRVFAYLVRRGFSPQTVMDTLNQL